jgi:transcriptional regulator with XRE-family HTH domain
MRCYICSAMVFDHKDYRIFLKTTLSEKAESHQGYSLRGFSQKIGVSNSYLSEVLSSKKSLSVELAFKIAVKLDLTEVETQYLCLLVQLEQEKDPSFREEFSRRLNSLNPNRKSHDLSVDVFKVISDWYHYAILELTYLSGFKLDATSAARKLGISKVEADGYVMAQSQIPNGAFKQYHRQVLEKAIESLQSQTPKERISATDILPIDSKYLGEVDRLSQLFASAVLKLAEKSVVKDGVYALSVHFFKLSHEGK